MDVKVSLKCHQMPTSMHEELALTYIEFFLFGYMITFIACALVLFS